MKCIRSTRQRRKRNKNEHVQRLAALLKASCQNAYEYIPKMCNALRKENPHISNRDVRDRIKKDCKDAGLATSTITHNIPLEFKNPNKVKAGKKSAEEKKKKKKILVQMTTVGCLESLEVLGGKKDECSIELPTKDEDVEKKKMLVPITALVYC